MTIELKIGQLNTSNATDGDLLVYVGANDVVEYRDVVSDIDSRVLANVNAVQDNVDTFASYANSTFVSSVSGTANEIDVSGSTSVTLSLPDNLIAPGDLTITGNLTVSGNTTYVNTETLEVEDNIITLNSSLGSGVTPTENAGLEVNRGAQANVQFRWNETLETWEYGEVDTSDFIRVDQSQSIVVSARNESGSTIAAGVPVYITGYSAGGSRPTIAPADADLAGAMPALGITLESANTNSNQRVVTYGTITTLNTSSFAPGDELYVSATVGTLQNTRPTGSSVEIQKIAKVLRADATDGSIIVMGAGRTNAIPNLPTDHVFIGDGGATHTTINLNATIQTQSAANDYSTYTTLVSLIDTVQDNVNAIPDSAANDYATYTTLISSINAVQDNVAQNVHQITTTGNTTTNSIEVAGLKTDSLRIGSTDLTATASELNLLDGVTGITLGNANELLVVGADGTSIVSDSTLGVDTGNNRLGINQTNPEVTLHMTGEGAQTAQIRMEQHNDSSDAPDIRTRKSRGTADSPAKNAAGDFIYRSNHERYNGSTYTTVGQLAVDTNSSNADRFQLTLAVSEDGNTVDAAQAQFKIDGNDSGAITFNDAYTFPTADGSSGQALVSNGGGQLSFTTVATTTAFQANDHATYTAVSSLVDTVQANLSTDVAVLDSFASYANSNFALSNEAVTFADLEVANLVVSGNFTIVGDVTTIESNNTVVSDPLILLNNGVSGANTLDAGFIINRGSSSNVALYYDESEDVLQVGYTTQGAEDSDITLDSRVIIRSDTVRAGNVEVGAGALRNEITAIGDQNLKISGNTLQAGNIEIASNVVPTQNAVFSIGSPTAQLKDIYVSDGTIFIGTNSQISAESVSLTNFNVDSDGTIRIPGVNISADANAVETVEIIASDLASNNLIQTQINTTVGFLTELNTTTQDNVVAAINELVTNIGTVSDNASGTSDSTSDQFTITTANAFTLSSSVSEANNIIVSVSGLVQLPNDDYVVSGTTLTLNNTTPLPQGASVEVRHLTSSGGSGGSTDFTAVASNIVPSANNVYSLGSPDKIWKDLYLANGTIYIGDTKISTTADGNVEFRSSSTDTRKTIEVDDLVIGSGSNRKRFRVDESGKFRLGAAAIDPDSDKDVSAEIDSALSKIDTVQANLTSVIGAAPTTLDTLAEIAAALENDANVAVTLTNQISTVDTDAKANTYNTYVTLNNRINTVSDNAAASGGSSSSTEAWEIISTNQTLTANTNYFVDVSSSARTVTLPSSPALGTKIHIADLADYAAINNIIVDRNSQKIQRNSKNLLVSSNSAALSLIYSNSTHGWLLGDSYNYTYTPYELPGDPYTWKMTWNNKSAGRLGFDYGRAGNYLEISIYATEGETNNINSTVDVESFFNGLPASGSITVYITGDYDDEINTSYTSFTDQGSYWKMSGSIRTALTSDIDGGNGYFGYALGGANINFTLRFGS